MAFTRAASAVSGGAPEGSMATIALILSGAVSAALKAKLPPWLCTTITQGQTFCT